jgi:toxin ParE1/3/4
MARKIRISFASSAMGDLEEIRAYYLSQNAVSAGEKILQQIISHIEILSKHPDMGRIVPEFDAKNLRELVRPPFRIIYRRDPGRVRIVRIWRSERLLKLPAK